jgi:hypothetical protein
MTLIPPVMAVFTLAATTASGSPLKPNPVRLSEWPTIAHLTPISVSKVALISPV